MVYEADYTVYLDTNSSLIVNVTVDFIILPIGSPFVCTSTFIQIPQVTSLSYVQANMIVVYHIYARYTNPHPILVIRWDQM